MLKTIKAKPRYLFDRGFLLENINNTPVTSPWTMPINSKISMMDKEVAKLSCC